MRKKSIHEMRNDPILMYMDQPPPCVQIYETVDKSIALLAQHTSHTVLILNETQLVGIITISDLTKLLRSEKPKTATDIGTVKKVIVTPGTTPMWKAYNALNGENSYQRILNVMPVIRSSEDKTPIGIIYRPTFFNRLGVLDPYKEYCNDY